MLPIANTNVVNWKLGIGIGNIYTLATFNTFNARLDSADRDLVDFHPIYGGQVL